VLISMSPWTSVRKTGRLEVLQRLKGGQAVYSPTPQRTVQFMDSSSS
jgi:hypothetical protein